MLTIGIVDDGLGAMAALCKLKQVISANYVCLVYDEGPLGEKKGRQLFAIGTDAAEKLKNMGCEIIVLSSISLTACCYKRFSAAMQDVAVYGCEAPILHASTYTASNVLAVGDSYALRNVNMSGVQVCPMPQFTQIAQTYDERRIVEYIRQTLEKYDGEFDCIALANSAMNMYKRCFSRVFPNVQIFDSLEGVARRIRKKYKKFAKDEASYSVINQKGEDVSDKYAVFFD